MLLIVPTWFGAASGEMVLLGFGDVVLPGLLLVYTRVFDLQHHRSLCSSYFVPASVGYGVGLMLTYGALYLQLGGDQVSMHAKYVLGKLPDAFMLPCAILWLSTADASLNFALSIIYMYISASVSSVARACTVKSTGGGRLGIKSSGAVP